MRLIAPYVIHILALELNMFYISHVDHAPLESLRRVSQALKRVLKLVNQLGIQKI